VNFGYEEVTKDGAMLTSRRSAIPCDSQLGQHDTPIMAWNAWGYFEGLKQQIDHAIDQGIMQKKHHNLFDFIE
jgi:predicted Rossmann-fold nucleotide-binding protein